MSIFAADSSGVDALRAVLLPLAKATAAIAAAGLAGGLLHRSAAAVKYWCWFLGLCAMLIVPALAVMLPGWRVLPGQAPPRVDHQLATSLPVPTPAPVAAAAPTPLLTVAPSQSLAINRAERAPAAASPSAQVSSDPAVGPANNVTQLQISWSSVVLAIWLAGAAIAFLPTMIATIRVRYIGRGCARLRDEDWLSLLASACGELGLRRKVELLQSRQKRMPMVWGILSAKLVVGADAADWPRQRRRAVLLHELAHVRRHDCLTELVGRSICCLYWFHPLAWIALSQMRRLRELACDDLVLGCGQEPTRYAQHLLHIAATMPNRRFAVGIQMARGPKLENRLLAILDARKRRRPMTRRLALLSAACALALATPLAMLRAADAPAPATNPAAQLEGDIRTVEGRPVPNAEVELIEYRTVEMAHGPEFVGINILASTHADAQGQFRLPKPNPADEPKRRGWDIRATANGLAYGLSYVQIRDGRISYFDVPRQMSTDRASIMLEPAARIAGTVVDQQGNPIAGAWVTRNDGADPVVSDASGRFVLDKLGMLRSRVFGGHAIIIIRHPQFAETRLLSDLFVTARENQMRVVLQQGAVVQGTISDADTGKPFKGFRVKADTGREDPLNEISTYSDEQGHYSLRVPVGHINLRPSPPAGADADSNYYPELDVWGLWMFEKNSPYTVDFKFHHAQTISGKIAGVDGAAASTLELDVTPTNPQWRRNSTNHHSGGFKPDGTFSISRMKPGEYELTVRRRPILTSLLNQTITVPDGKDLTDITVTIAPDLARLAVDERFEVHGNARYADGTAAANAKIELLADRAPDPYRVPVWRTTYAAPDGSFVLRLVPTGYNWTVWAHDPSGTRGAAEVLGGDAELKKPVSLILQNGTEFSGTVRDANGKGLPNYGVGIFAIVPSSTGGSGWPLISTLTDQQGGYTLKGFVAPPGSGKYSLEAQPMPSTSRTISSPGFQNLDVRPQVKHDGLDFEVKDDWIISPVQKK